MECSYMMPYVLSAYLAFGFVLWIGLRPRCEMRYGLASEILLLGMCVAWVIVIPVAFIYHGKITEKISEEFDDTKANQPEIR